MKNLDLTIYDKNSGVGGTWFSNRYPVSVLISCRCAALKPKGSLILVLRAWLVMFLPIAYVSTKIHGELAERCYLCSTSSHSKKM